MDTQRYALLIALALVGWMTLVEWNGFREEHRKQQAVAEQAAPVTLSEAVSAELPAPAATGDAAVPAGGTDLPAVHAQPNAEAATAPASASAPADTIRVFTDTLQLEISLVGGDIVSAALPEHLAELDKPELPFQLLEQKGDKSYIAQSGLIGANGTDKAEGRPRFTAEQSTYRLPDGQEQLEVALHHTTADGIEITKQFRFEHGAYVVDMEYRVRNTGSTPWQAALFGQLRRDNRPDPAAIGGALGIKPFIGFASRTADEPYIKHTFDDLVEEPYKAETQGGWIALVQHYFISAWIPADGQQNSFEMLKSQSGHNIGRFTSPPVTIAPGATGTLGARFYAGPKDQYRLYEISPGLDLTVDYGWLWWIAQPLFALLYFFATGELHAFGWVTRIGSGIGNWGVAIILLTFLVKATFFRLSAASYQSMAKMRKLQPKMLELRERYGEDRQKLSQETMDLYRREKVNPLGGCLPILIQMPVFLALYWVLLESVELRHAPFFGWIHDLSVMDPLFVLPLLMGASMYFQQKLNPPPPDPMQAKVFQFMPIIFTVFFLFFPAGLVLYWLVNNVLSIAQQWVITRRIEQGG